jgi:hypothetical protein
MLYTGLQEARACLLERYVVFTKIHSTELYQTRNTEKKATHMNIFEVTKFFTLGILRNPCVNERYRCNDRHGLHRYLSALRNALM